jgi:hypothetical protein
MKGASVGFGAPTTVGPFIGAALGFLVVKGDAVSWVGRLVDAPFGICVGDSLIGF